jgi:hypothetical protein
MRLFEDLQAGKYNCILFILIFVLLFHCYWTKPETMADTSTTTEAIRAAVKAVYLADVQAIRNLSEVAVKLQSNDGLTIPGTVNAKKDVYIDGMLNVGTGITSNKTIILKGNDWLDTFFKNGIHIRNENGDGNGNLWVDGNLRTGALNSDGDVAVGGNTSTNALTIKNELKCVDKSGNKGQCLISQGPGVAPIWNTLPTNMLFIPAGSNPKNKAKTFNIPFASSAVTDVSNFSKISCISGNMSATFSDGGSGDDSCTFYFILRKYNNVAKDGSVEVWNGSGSNLWGETQFDERIASPFIGRAKKSPDRSGDFPFVFTGTDIFPMLKPLDSASFIDISLIGSKNSDDTVLIKWSNIIFLLSN